MQNRMPILVSIAAAVLAVLAMNMYISDLRQSIQPPTRLVMVARRDLRAGTLIAAEDVAAAAKVESSIPKFAIAWPARGNYIGQRLGTEAAQGDYILATQFGAAAAGAARASEKIDPHSNDRLFTLPVTAETSLEGAIRAGDRIDLLLTYNLIQPAAAGGKQALPQVVTAPLLDNVYVLYTGAYGSNPRAAYSSLTFLLTPDQAKLLTWAQNLGKLSALLRHPKNLQASERTYIAGDTATLKELARQSVTVDEAVSKRASTDKGEAK